MHSKSWRVSILTIVAGAVVATAMTVAALLAVQPTPAQADSHTVAVKGCTGKDVKLKREERRMLYRHNRTRIDRDRKPLCIHPKLQRVAREHSRDMIRRDYFDHDTEGSGESACDRVREIGYRYRLCGENIAFGSGDLGKPDEIFKSWMQSTGHRRNILKPGFREIGIGAVTGEYEGYENTTMWTADFGTR